jgi:ankyrin repeat protein
MSPKLTPQSNLESLRKEAKRWLKALRADDPQAFARLARIYPVGEAQTLRIVQHALALEYGFSSWAALKRELEDRALAARSHNERVTLFLAKSANRYNVAPGSAQWNTYEPDKPARGELAARLLTRHPEIARDSIHAATAAHDIDVVRNFLAQDAALANQRGGRDGWTPLLRLAYTRLPIEALPRNAIAIATALMDHGADPNVGWSDSQNNFTALTGVIGGGEAGQTAHPQAEALARLLIARGADPFDRQALYNTSLGADSTFWLELLWSESDKRGEASKWTCSPSLAGASAVDYLLGNAVPRHPHRVEWLLQHGANANALNAYSKEPVIKHAIVAGNQDVIDLLVRHGAKPPELTDSEVFLSAAAQGDTATLRRLADLHPEYLQRPDAIFTVIQQRRADIAELLLNLGTSPNVADEKGFSALHYTTHCGAAGIAALLITRGADVDAIEHRYNGTPLGHANYQRRPEMVAVIAPYSHDIRGLCFAGAIDRLTELIAADPSLASKMTRGEPPLFALPDNEERAVDVAEFLLAQGADPTVKNPAGLTPAEAAKKRGLDEAAATISAAEP